MAPALPSLVSPDELHAALEAAAGRLRVLDASTTLVTHGEGEPYTAGPLREQYLAAHVPGAAFVDVTSELSDRAGRHAFTLPPADALAAAFGAVGIGDDTHVVVYDTVGSAWATRVWWLLRWLGHDQVSVLDGGLAAWLAAGFTTASGEDDDLAARAAVEVLTPRERPELLATLPQVARISSGEAPGLLVNALDPATFRGDQEVSTYSRRGRIPGSVNLPLFTLLDPDTGQFLPTDALRDKLQAGGLLDADGAVTYCGGGVAATLPAFAAYVVAGVEVAVYDGSLSEWTADERLSVVAG
jgi:thiosulfate/3-mercaptopyruvate sulfurtransferase